MRKKLVINVDNTKNKDWCFDARLMNEEDNTPPEPMPRYTDAWYHWHYKYRDPAGDYIWGAYITTEGACCSFDTLSGFHDDGSPMPFKEAKPYIDEIAQAVAKKLAIVNRYVAAYVPNTREYALTTEIVKRAGFQEGIATRSNHGRYKNIRWEWFPTNEKQCIIPAQYAPQLRKHEKNLPTITV